jgi:hypothetical protein
VKPRAAAFAEGQGGSAVNSHSVYQPRGIPEGCSDVLVAQGCRGLGPKSPAFILFFGSL